MNGAKVRSRRRSVQREAALDALNGEAAAVQAPQALAQPRDAALYGAIGRARRDAPDHLTKVAQAHVPPGVRREEVEKAVLRGRERHEVFPDQHFLVEAQLEVLHAFGARER